MKLTKTQKIYVGVLGLAAAALMVDRLFLLPAETSAETHAAAQFAVPPSAGGVDDLEVFTPPEGPASPQVELARGLEALAARRGLDPADVRDAFHPAQVWLDAGLGASGPGPTKSVTDRFKEAHTLTAVMASGADGYAIIDGRTLFIGQLLDGFVLVEVGPRRAEFESGQTRVVLTLPE